MTTASLKCFIILTLSIVQPNTERPEANEASIYQPVKTVKKSTPKAWPLLRLKGPSNIRPK